MSININEVDISDWYFEKLVNHRLRTLELARLFGDDTHTKKLILQANKLFNTQGRKYVSALVHLQWLTTVSVLICLGDLSPYRNNNGQEN